MTCHHRQQVSGNGGEVFVADPDETMNGRRYLLDYQEYASRYVVCKRTRYGMLGIPLGHDVVPEAANDRTGSVESPRFSPIMVTVARLLPLSQYVKVITTHLTCHEEDILVTRKTECVKHEATSSITPEEDRGEGMTPSA